MGIVGSPSVESMMVPSKSSRTPAKMWDAKGPDSCVSGDIFAYGNQLSTMWGVQLLCLSSYIFISKDVALIGG